MSRRVQLRNLANMCRNHTQTHVGATEVAMLLFVKNNYFLTKNTVFRHAR